MCPGVHEHPERALNVLVWQEAGNCLTWSWETNQFLCKSSDLNGEPSLQPKDSYLWRKLYFLSSADTSACHSTHADFRGKPAEISSLLLPHSHRVGTQAIGLGDKCLCPLSHTAGLRVVCWYSWWLWEQSAYNNSFSHAFSFAMSILFGLLGFSFLNCPSSIRFSITHKDFVLMFLVLRKPWYSFFFLLCLPGAGGHHA